MVQSIMNQSYNKYFRILVIPVHTDKIGKRETKNEHGILKRTDKTIKRQYNQNVGL